VTTVISQFLKIRLKVCFMDASSEEAEGFRPGVRALMRVSSRLAAGSPKLSLSRGADLLHLSEQEKILRVEGLKKVFRSGESDLVLFENQSF